MATKAKKKTAGPAGGGELKAFRTAVQDLKAAGKALAKAAKADKKLAASSGVRVAMNSLQNTTMAIAKSLPTVVPAPTPI